MKSSHNIKLYADKNINEIDFSSGDCIFLPGGMPGTTNLGACEKLADEIVEYNNQGKLLAAICAAPTVFSNLGFLKIRMLQAILLLRIRWNVITMAGE